MKKLSRPLTFFSPVPCSLLRVSFLSRLCCASLREASLREASLREASLREASPTPMSTRTTQIISEIKTDSYIVETNLLSLN
ncbi:pentapeptide repeat-containing protein [Nostoc sp. DedQUE04]|uniref:pentapeptide repeat-containing protein n=1 Tax=Nostoc sp. DedQUE04 TaxID=3075390 RepID=UPI003A0FD60C